MIKASNFFAILLGLLLCSPVWSGAQEKKLIDKLILETQLSLMIENKDYVFIATTVAPMNGMAQQVTSGPSVRVAGDSVMSDLPYFGNSYASVYSGGGGIQFTSVKNTYTVKQMNKGGWDILIKPSNRSGVVQMHLTVHANGEALLHITNSNRDPITFNGYIQRKEKPATTNSPNTPN